MIALERSFQNLLEINLLAPWNSQILPHYTRLFIIIIYITGKIAVGTTAVDIVVDTATWCGTMRVLIITMSADTMHQDTSLMKTSSRRRSAKAGLISTMVDSTKGKTIKGVFKICFF